MKLCSILIAATAMVLALPAHAVTFTFSIDSNYGAGSGTFETEGTGETPTLVTSLTGTFAGAAATLLAPGTYPSSFPNDNLFTTSAPFFDFSGLSFSAGGSSYNLYSDAGGLQFCGRTSTCTLTVLNSFSVSAAAVPEPATWAMMLVGFGMLGAAMRYRRKSTAVSFA